MRPLLPVPLLAALLLSPPALADHPPTRAALRKAFETNRATVVEVVGPHRSGTGVLVGTSGQVLTSVDFVGLYDARVRREGRELPAKVLLANASLKVAVLEIDPPGEFPAPAVRQGGDPGEGTALVAIARSRKGALAPSVAQVLRGAGDRAPFLELDIPLEAGTPLFDAQGRLAALAVGGTRRHTTRALPVSAVREQLAAGPRP